MASGSHHCEKMDSEESLSPVIQLTQSQDIMPTLCIVASYGQWYPEELQSSSSPITGDTMVNDCSPVLSSETQSRERVLSSDKRRSMLSTSAGKSETNGKKKVSASEQRRAQSRFKTDPRKTKTDTSPSQSKYSRVLKDNAVSFEKSDGQSARISGPYRTEVDDRHISSVSHRTRTHSAKNFAASVRDDQRQNRHISQPNRLDVCESVASSVVTKTSASESESSFGTRGDAINTYRAVEGTKEHGAGELVNFVVKLQPLLVWTDVFSTDSSECNGDLLSAGMSALEQQSGGMGDSKALIECVVNGRAEGFESGFKLPSADVNTFHFENMPLNRNDICKLSCENVIDNAKSENLVNNYEDCSLQNNHTDVKPINYLGMDVDNNLKERWHYSNAHIFHRGKNVLNDNIHKFHDRRCFSSDNLCVISKVEISSSRLLSCSTGAVYGGDRPVCRWPPTAVQYDCGGCDNPAVKEAVLLSSQGDADCLQQLPAVTCSSDARLTDALLTSADHPGGQQTGPVLLTDDSRWRAGALCCAAMETDRTLECGQPLPSNFVSCGLVVAERAETGVSSRPQQSTAVADKSRLSVPPHIPTVACCTAGEDSALYFAEPQLCLSVCPSERRRTDLVMGLVESLTDDVSMDKNTVESLDVSSSQVVSVRGDADVQSSSTGQSDAVRWHSVLNPTHSGASAEHIVPTSGIEAASETVSNPDVRDDVDVGVQLSVDALGCSSTEEAPRDLRQLMLSACEGEVRLATESGVIQPADVKARRSVDDHTACSSRAAKRDVQAVDAAKGTCSSERADSDAVLYCDDYQHENLAVEYTDDVDDRWQQSRVIDDVVKYRGSDPVCVGPVSAKSFSQQDYPVSSQESPAAGSHGDDVTGIRPEAARDERPSAAVSAGVTDERLAGDRTLEALQQNTPPTAAAPTAVSCAPLLTKSDHRRTYASGGDVPVSDDGQVDNVVETDPGGARMTSDVTCADAVSMAGPPRCSDEALSTSPSNGHVSSDSAAMKLDRLSTSPTTSADDDDDVDRKLADELERLKNLAMRSPKICSDETAMTVCLQPDDNSLSMPDAGDCCVKDLDAACDISSTDNEQSLHHDPSSASEAAEADVELPYIPTSSNTGLHKDLSAVANDTQLGAESFADNDASQNSEPSTDSPLPTSSAVKCQEATHKVSCTEQHDAAAASTHSCLDASVSFMMDNDLHQTVSHASSDRVVRVANSAIESALVDVILEAEQNLFLFMGVGVPHNTLSLSSSVLTSSNYPTKCDIACSTSSVLPDIVQDSLVNETTETATELADRKSLKCAVTCPFQNCCVKLPHNISLGDRAVQLVLRGTVGDDGKEIGEMTWNELKVLAEMLYAEQRLLAQLNSACRHLQVAYCYLIVPAL